METDRISIVFVCCLCYYDIYREGGLASIMITVSINDITIAAITIIIIIVMTIIIIVLNCGYELLSYSSSGLGYITIVYNIRYILS